jgi:hypothetical protein
MYSHYWPPYSPDCHPGRVQVYSSFRPIPEHKYMYSSQWDTYSSEVAPTRL